MNLLPRRLAPAVREGTDPVGPRRSDQRGLGHSPCRPGDGPETLVAVACAWAEELSHGSPAAVALAKAILGRSHEDTDEDIFQVCFQAQAVCCSARETRTSVEAFLAKAYAKG
jgi:hypothetical protein